MTAAWLEGKLDQVHLKWMKIQHKIDRKKHQHIINKPLDAHKSPATQGFENRGDQRVLGDGGVVQMLEHKIYQEGLVKLNNNSFADKAEKEEWFKFVAQLSPKELVMVQKTDFE